MGVPPPFGLDRIRGFGIRVECLAATANREDHGYLGHLLAVKNQARVNREETVTKNTAVALLFLAFVEQSSRKIEEILARLRSGCPVDVTFDETIGLPPLVCRWSCTRDGRTTCTFGRFIFERHASDSLHRWIAMFPLFARVAARGGFPGHVMLNLGDLGSHPGVAFCDFRDLFTMIPDFAFIESDGYAEYRNIFADDRHWDDRSDAVFWRGSTTGHPVEDPLDLPRVRLCLIGRDHPEQRLDFGISQIVQFDAQQSHRLHESDVCRDFVPWQQLDRYKFHVDIDGNTNSWPGLLSKLHCGGLVFKVASPHGYRQWYYNRLLPWVHYVPVKSDMSDLLDLIALMRGDDALARRIAEQGQAFARTLTLDAELDAGCDAVFSHAVRSAVESA